MTLPLIDHLALRVRDERRSRTFYEQALEPFGVKVVESSRGPGFAVEGGGDFWIEEGEPPAATTARRVSPGLPRRVLRSVRH